MLNSRNALFKFGGKILENEAYLENSVSQLKELYDKKVLDKIVIIPGGGTVANFVRSLDLEMKLGDEKSHWMAIQAMDFNGQKLASNYKYLENIDKIEYIIKKQRIFAILLPLKHIKNHDFLPHSWQVTSDSISLFLANELAFKSVFLIKDIDGLIRKDNTLIKKISTIEYKNIKKNNQLKKMENNQPYKTSAPIDDYLFDLIDEYNLPCIILNGAKPRTISNFFLKKKNVLSTQLLPI